MAIYNSRLNTLDEKKLAANSSSKVGIEKKRDRHVKHWLDIWDQRQKGDPMNRYNHYD